MKPELLPLSNVADALASGAVSPEALARGVARAHPRGWTGACTRSYADGERGAHAAKAAAQRRAERQAAGAVGRVPIALKDIFCMEGVETTCGSKILRGTRRLRRDRRGAGSSRPGPSSSAS